jgi:hypothetical protein
LGTRTGLPRSSSERTAKLRHSKPPTSAEQHFANIDLGGYARWKAVERVLTLRGA